MVKNRTKAVGLFSGGLDSTLAAKLMLEQGIEVNAVNFTSPFCTCTPKKAGCAAVVTAVKGLGKGSYESCVKIWQIIKRDTTFRLIKILLFKPEVKRDIIQIYANTYTPFYSFLHLY